MLFAKPAYAHGGGLDSSGGHNCYVGSCSGTYHFHGDGLADLIGDNLGIIFFLAIIVAVIFAVRQETKDSNQLPKLRDKPPKNITESQSQTIHQEHDKDLENSTTDGKIQSAEIDVVTIDRDKSLSASVDFLVQSFIEEKMSIDDNAGYFESIEAIQFIAGFSDTYLTSETEGRYLDLSKFETEPIVKDIVQRILPNTKDDPTIFEKVIIIDDNLESKVWEAGMDRYFEATSDYDWVMDKTKLKIDWLKEYTKWLE